MKKLLCLMLVCSAFSLHASNNLTAGNDSILCAGFLASAGPDQVICAGESVVIGLDHGSLSDSSGYIFSWSPAEGLDHPDAANPTASPAGNTTYILTVSHRDKACVASDTVNIAVKQPSFLMFFPPGPHYICSGQQVTLTGAFGFSNYSWEGPDGTKEGRIVQAGAAGVYRLSATDAQGCRVKADSFVLHVRTPLPLQTNPAGVKKICTGQSAQFAAAQGFIAYNWHTPSGTIGGRFITATVPGNYFVTATDANSCLSTSATVRLEVNTPEPLEPAFNGKTTLCPGESVMLGAPDGFSNHFWTGPSGQLSGKNILVSQPGAYQLKAFDRNLCLSVAEPVNLIAVQPAPLQILYEAVPFICRDGEKELEASNGFKQYIWTLPAGQDSGMRIVATGPGLYQVSAIDSNHCVAVSASLDLKEFPHRAIRMNRSADTTVCQGDTIRLIPETGLAGYQWDTPYGSVSKGPLEVTDPGTYRVSARDSNGCMRSTDPVRINHHPLIRPVVLSDGRDTLCPGDARKLSCNPGFTAHIWNTPAGSTENEYLETNVGGVYSVTAKDSNGCQASSMLLLIHESLPFRPEIHTDFSLEQCVGEVVRLSADTGYRTYQWSNGSAEPHATVENSGPMSLQVTNRMGCTGHSDTLVFSFAAEPEAAFSYSHSGGLQAIQFYNESKNAESWLWDFGDGHTSQEEHPVHSYSSRGIWSVSLVVENYCGRDTVYRELKVEPATGLNDRPGDARLLQLYPNPGNERLVVQLPGKMARGTRILLQDIAGKAVLSENTGNEERERVELQTGSLAPGIYTLILVQNQLRQTARWMKH